MLILPAHQRYTTLSNMEFAIPVVEKGKSFINAQGEPNFTSLTVI
jgi:hypothetical protein